MKIVIEGKRSAVIKSLAHISVEFKTTCVYIYNYGEDDWMYVVDLDIKYYDAKQLQTLENVLTMLRNTFDIRITK